jgi:hypothetical protein
MKAISKIFLLFVVLHTVSWIAPQKASAQLSVDFQVFYDDLSPYGNWVDNSDYGYVWAPDVSSGFSPYSTNGHWIYTYAGWTWVSNYSWGWAPFHYGRWFYDRYYGWLWAPDTEWGPGWVSWRRSNDYYGWAPIGPGISIDIAYGSGYNLPHNQWTFVRNRDFGRTNINNYYINNSNNVTIINNTTVINNIRRDDGRNSRYNAGPDRTEVERRAGRKFAPVALTESNKPGQNLSNGKLQMYRPRVEKNNSVGRKPVPSKVANLEDVKNSRQRSTESRPQKENQPNKVQPSKQQSNDQPTKQPPQQRSDQPAKQPVKQEPRKDQPTKQPPQQRSDQPAKQPVKQEPRNDQPTKQPPQQRSDQPVPQPVKQEPRKDQPTKQPPQQRSDQPVPQPVKQEPRKDQPTNQPPQQRSDQPVQQPVKQEPRKDQPTNQPPQQRSDQPAKQPVKQEPPKDQPTKKQRKGIDKRVAKYWIGK